MCQQWGKSTRFSELDSSGRPGIDSRAYTGKDPCEVHHTKGHHCSDSPGPYVLSDLHCSTFKTPGRMSAVMSEAADLCEARFPQFRQPKQHIVTDGVQKRRGRCSCPSHDRQQRSLQSRKTCHSSGIFLFSFVFWWVFFCLEKVVCHKMLFILIYNWFTIVIFNKTS